MKKVSILSLHLGYGGIEKSVVALANMLSSKYDVEIACCYQLYEKSVFPLDQKVKVQYLNDQTIIPNKSSFQEALHSRNIIKIIKEGFFAVKVLYFRKKSIVDYIKKCDSDIIISTRDIFNTWLGSYGKKGILKIGWEHNHFHNNLKYANKVVSSVLKLDYFVLVSEELKKYYEERLKNTSCTCITIPNCIELLPEKISKLNDKRLLSVGRLSSEKGYMDLLRIYNSFQKKNKDWVLDIVGDGVEKSELERYIQDHHLEEKVTLHGFQGKDVIEKIMLSSSIYLMSSYTESFGIVLIEAMSYGIPCIAFDSAEGARDIIKDGVNGYLISNRNDEEMIQKIERLVSDDSLRIKMGKEARSSVKKYTSDVVKEEWFKLLEKSDYDE